MSFSPDSVAKHHLFLAVKVSPLDLAIVANELLSNCIVVMIGGAVILL